MVSFAILNAQAEIPRAICHRLNPWWCTRCIANRTDCKETVWVCPVELECNLVPTRNHNDFYNCDLIFPIGGSEGGGNRG
jgi:hypothetical protein